VSTLLTVTGTKQKVKFVNERDRATGHVRNDMLRR
jgi:hypothetical protein